jgi:hypothetical protein
MNEHAVFIRSVERIPSYVRTAVDDQDPSVTDRRKAFCHHCPGESGAGDEHVVPVGSYVPQCLGSEPVGRDDRRTI